MICVLAAHTIGVWHGPKRRKKIDVFESDFKMLVSIWNVDTKYRYSVAECTFVRPDKLKCQSQEQRKVDCRAEQEQEADAQKPELMVFREKFSKAKLRVRAEELVSLFSLVGDEVSGRCSRNPVLAWSYHPPLGGAVVPAGELRYC